MTDAVRPLLITCLLVSGSALAAPAPRAADSVPDEVLVAFRPGTAASDVAAIHRNVDADKADRLAEVKSGTIWRLHSRSKNTAALVKALEHNPNIAYVEPNYVVRLEATPNDPSYPQLWGLRNNSHTAPGYAGAAGADINAPAAWNVTTGSSSIVVGVVDTGIDYTHPDLAANIWSNPGGAGNVNCAAGSHGFNAITKSCDPMEDHYHGTHVAGTIGASGNNGTGVVGVNWTASIMALKFLDRYGSGTTADAITAIDFAVQAKIDGVNVRVLNNSWGGGPFSKALFDEILKANEHGILFVAAAGNSAYNTDTYPMYPAAYGAPNVISVAATTNADRLASFSNYGSATVHLGAPGEGIYSTYPNATYATLSGTSMASPHVAGVAALLLAHDPDMTTAQVKSTILDNVDPIPSLAGKTVTGGRLNAAKALGVVPSSDFSLSLGASPAMILRGGVATVDIAITPIGSFSDEVGLTVSGLPSATTAAFSANPALTASTLTLTTSTSTPTSDYTMTINATSGELAHSVSFKLSLVAAAPVATCPVVSTSSSPTVYAYPSAAATGDFNRDGRIDLAVVSAASNGTSILLGQSQGFAAATQIKTPGSPIAVATADFDRDGILDLATAGSASSNVSILLGLGDGRFSPPASFACGANPFGLAVGDFNGDGRSDLAVANNGSGNVSILISAGDGSFAAPADYAVGSGPYWIAAGDFNRDGHLDLAVAVHNAGTVSVLLGLGDGSFESAVAYSMGSGTSYVATGDIDGDGAEDLIATGFSSDDVSVRLGAGDGTFLPAVSYAVGDSPTSAALVDADKDGDLDLAVTSSVSQKLTIFPGQGDGTFGSAVDYASSYQPAQVLAADFDRNGRADLAVVHASSDRLSIIRTPGACTINCGSLTPLNTYTTGAGPSSLATGDFDHDGSIDVAIANRASNSVSIALGGGDGSFLPNAMIATGSAPRAVGAIDLNGDGALDLAVANEASDDVSILLGNADGTFQSAVSHAAGTAPAALAIEDFNRDGRADIAVANRGANSVSLLLATGAGGFATAVSTPVGTNPEALAAADFDRDGILDLATANNGSNDVTILRGDGDGTFAEGTAVTAGTSPSALVSADFDRDGKADLAVTNEGSGNVSILRGTGDGGFASAISFVAGPAPSAIAAGDFDGDSIIDLAVTDRASATVSLHFGLGDGTFTSGIDDAAGTTPAAIVAAELDHDGRLDLLVANAGADSLTILHNDCPEPDLVVSKSHTGDATQGQKGKNFTITVTNAGAGPSKGLVTMTDVLPNGMVGRALSGSGWQCSPVTVACSRGDSLAAGASFPPITASVDIANTASASLTNKAIVAGGGEFNTTNDEASDSLAVAPATDLVIELSHSSSFVQGATGRHYSIVVRNPGGAPTAGTVTVTDTLPAGLTATAIGGSGWNCSLGSLACNRSDTLAAGTSYPAITVTVSVAAGAPTSVTNIVTVSGGGETDPTNNTAFDPTTIWSTESCGTFGSPVRALAGRYGTAIAAGDLDGDGVTDLVVAKYYTGGFVVALGSGDGGFTLLESYLPNVAVHRIVIIDLNRDGVQDLAISGSSGISTFRGVGDGTFVSIATVGVGSYADGLIASDFNGDGSVDLAVFAGYPAKLWVLIGNGDGSLRPPMLAGDLLEPRDLVASDFDGDGFTDIAAAQYYDDSVAILRGNGDGTFGPPVRTPVGSSFGPVKLATGDLNGDGKADLLASLEWGYVSVLIGNGDASFAPSVNYSRGYSSSRAVVIEDVDGDGRKDIAVAAYGLETLPGNGDGTFQPARAHGLGYQPDAFVIADFNRDGRADIAANYSYDGFDVMLGGCPDLTIAKSHTGNLRVGETGVYSLVVSNSGSASSAGEVTVSDMLPTGLTARNIYGSGWNCTVTPLSCKRSDALAPGLNFDEIRLSVNVSNTAPASVTNVASVNGGSERNTANNSASDPTTITQGIDLKIFKGHSQTFVAGGTATYTITVSNVGTQATTSTVTVIDALPTGLTATAVSGTGWSCSLGSLTCTRSDALAASMAYPAITLTVNVAPSCASSITNVATVSVTGDFDTTNNSASDPTVVLRAPSSIAAHATSSTAATVSWSTVYGAADYVVYRATGSGGYSAIGSSGGVVYYDTSLAPNTVYRYKVHARSGAVLGPMSSAVSTMTVTFTDDPIVAGATVIKAVHFDELRADVNLMRAAAGLSPATFTDPPLSGRAVRAVHFAEIWERLNEARQALGLYLVSYSDYPMSPGTPIKAVHIQQLRNALR